jgi:hypothetical protein
MTAFFKTNFQLLLIRSVNQSPFLIIIYTTSNAYIPSFKRHHIKIISECNEILELFQLKQLRIDYSHFNSRLRPPASQRLDTVTVNSFCANIAH